MSKIQWTDKTVNPAPGCTKVSLACDNCYAEKMAKRLAHIGYETGNKKLFEKYGKTVDYLGRWTGHVSLDITEMEKVLKWKKPQKIFVNSMGDLFHENVPDLFIISVFAIMAEAYWHTFQILTKRPERMKEILTSPTIANEVWLQTSTGVSDEKPVWPLPNVWLGVTAENQEQADKRIPIILQTPVAIRFVSVEPMLGPVDLTNIRTSKSVSINALEGCGVDLKSYAQSIPNILCNKLDWVICGTESGPKRRPAKIDWIRSLKNQCEYTGTPFFLKQMEVNGKLIKMPEFDGREWNEFPKEATPCLPKQN